MSFEFSRDCTTVVAVDRRHADQLQTVWPTWMRHRPEIRTAPLLLVCDAHPETGGDHAYWRDRLGFVYADHPHVLASYWEWPGRGAALIHQRERMLTALVRVPPQLVQTPWWLKLDTDAVAVRPGAWFDAAWFAGDPPAAIVSSPWGYAKPPDVIEILDRWADGHPDLSLFPALGHRPVPGSEIVKYPRIISWCCWMRTNFSGWASELVPAGGRLPVPSQDTYVDYVAQRTGCHVLKVRMKQFGWDHVRGDRTLKRLAAEAMREAVAQP